MYHGAMKPKKKKKKKAKAKKKAKKYCLSLSIPPSKRSWLRLPHQGTRSLALT